MNNKKFLKLLSEILADRKQRQKEWDEYDGLDKAILMSPQEIKERVRKNDPWLKLVEPSMFPELRK